MIALGLIAAAVVPLFATEEPITPTPTNDNESYRVGPVTNDTEFYSNETGQTPSNKR